MNLSFKRIVVTGGAGFLGSRVVEHLRAKGAQVFVPLIEEYNLVELESVKRLYDDFNPEIVIHLAAVVGGIGANRANPGSFFYDNLMMGVQIIHEGYLRKIEKLVAVGTICAYPKFCQVPFKEDDIWNGYPEETNAPYGLAKKMLLVQSQAYRQQYNFNSIILFPVNLYGPGDNFNPSSSHVIPAMIKKFVEAKEQNLQEVILWGDGSPTREFLYVNDAAKGIILATEQYNSSDPVNLGSGMEISIKNLADTISQLCDYKGQIIWDTSQPNGQPRRCLDTTRAREQFNFVASTPFQEGLKQTYDWYVNQTSESPFSENLDQTTLNLIKRWQKAARIYQ